MSLPDGNRQPWPPKGWSAVYDDYAAHAAWYAGDPEQLARVYGGAVTLRGRPVWWKFWSRVGDKRAEHSTRSQLHVPLPGDVAATSAALLFGESPEFEIPGALDDPPDANAKATQLRLDKIIDEGGVRDRLTEAAETCSAFGGVFLKPDWDTTLADVPLLSVVQADNAVPDFRYGMLTAVTLWRVVIGADSSPNGNAEIGQRIYRHLERHEVRDDGRGIILHGLYRGSKTELGTRLPLTQSSETEGLQDEVSLPFDGLGIRYIANMRPHRKYRGSALGQSDYAGCEGLFDALDETFTSWMRDVRLAKARIIVPEEFLEKRNDNFQFDVDREIYVGIDMAPDVKAIEPVQFDIRVNEHRDTSIELVERIISHAGYSPQTFGLHIEGRAESGTALRVRERKTLTTQQRKRRYWEPNLADVLEMMLAIDREVFRSGVPVIRPRVSLADSVMPDPIETASTVDMLNRALAVSLETKVEMLHPEWTPAERAAEVQRLRDEQGLAVPDMLQVGIA